MQSASDCLSVRERHLSLPEALTSWGARMVGLKDPDGNNLYLLQEHQVAMDPSSAKTDLIVRGLLPLLKRAGSRLITLIAVLCCAIHAHSAGAQIASCASEVPPSEQFGELFRNVQLKRVFPDSKTFADLHFDESPNAILSDYEARKVESGFDLGAFVHQHFSLPPEGPTVPSASPGEPIDTYIARLWDVLSHQSEEISSHSSLIPLPHPYVVPGGRFRELYYWDSYFTMLGLEADGRHDLALNMLKNFAFEIDCYGHVPNGNRTYYLSRSQPPFFSLMVDVIAERVGEGSYVTYLPELEAEYEYWMDGSAILRRGQSYRRVVRLSDGTILNRYWDDRAEPRDESYREDVATAREGRRDPGDVYRDLRAAAEAGWDFGSRWLTDGHTLSTIRTTSILPVDLNSLMVHLEQTLAKAYRIGGDGDRSSHFVALAVRREAAIRKLMWNERFHAFTDYAWRSHKALPVTAAGLFPLFLHVANQRQAEMEAQTVRRKLLMPGGIATTLLVTGQQWDQPNGWAPLQWIAVVGLKNYNEAQLAEAIAKRWSCEVINVYQRSRVVVEKYNLMSGRAGGGGEYAVQVGFGWTNGVLRALTSLYPALSRLSPQLCGASGAASP
jgi:alpha,alpha-trehalase